MASYKSISLLFKANQVKAYEVEAKAANLNSNDTFLLTKPGDGPFGYDASAYAWYGQARIEKTKNFLVLSCKVEF